MMIPRMRSWLSHLNVFSPRTIRLLFWLGGAFFLFGLFVKVTWELHEDAEVPQLDRAILLFIEKFRVSRLNGSAVDFSALGSPTLILLFTLIGLAILVLNRDRFAALYLAIGSAGAGALTYILKHLISRDRPEVIPKLVEVTGFSYPSGHSVASSSFYLILAFLACRYYEARKSRAVIFVIASLLILGVAFSRLYLGVHYPSDVVSGVCLGAAWAFFLTGLFSMKSLMFRSKPT